MSETADIRIESFGLDRDTIHRWRRRLKEPEKYRAMLYGAAHAKAMASRPRGGPTWPALAADHACAGAEGRRIADSTTGHARRRHA